MKTFIIAEIGINHNGNIELAKKLVDMSIRCGCDAVKFQKRTIDLVYTQEYLDGPRESPWGKTQREQKEGLELNENEYDEIDKYCSGKNIPWFASAWDLESLSFLNKYNLKYNKIASAMITNSAFVKAVAKQGKPTFISLGKSEGKTTAQTVKLFEAYSCPYTLMHCVALYPCPPEKCNLTKIMNLWNRYECPVGYSSHYQGVIDKVLAVAYGASVLEMHITLDKTMYGTDQPASLEERELAQVVQDAELVGRML